MNDAILSFIYRLEFIVKILFTRLPVIIYVNKKVDFRDGDEIQIGDFVAKLKKKK